MASLRMFRSRRAITMVAWSTLMAMTACPSDDAAVGSAGQTGTADGSTSMGTGPTTGDQPTGSGSVSASATGTTGVADTSTTAPADSSSDDGSSTGGACRTDAECDDDNPCTDDLCGAAAGCTNDPINGLPADEGQVDGDCQVILCVFGEPQATNNDDDVPDDTNVCTADLCDQGVPSHPDLPAGTPCNRDGLCDGEGTCSECVSPDDCDQLPPDDACQTRTCDDNTCGQVFVDADTQIDLQTPGDCQVLVCDGAGGTVSQNDDADVPNDGLECTDDVCDQGVPAFDPIDAGEPCSAGLCDGNGGCVGCLMPDDCLGVDTFCRTITCDNGACGVDLQPEGTPLPLVDQTAGDCLELQCDDNGNVVAVAADADVPAEDGNDCTISACVAGVPQQDDAQINSDCDDNGGSFCDGTGACVECNFSNQCADGPQCFDAACNDNVCELEPTPNEQCDDGSFCTGIDTCNAAGACIPGTNPCPGPDGDADCSETCDELANNCDGDDTAGAACSDGLFCTTGDVCDGSGTCNGGGDPCSANLGDNDIDCTESCDEGTDSCTGNDPNGSACNDSLFCTATDTCNAGVCGGTGNPCTVNVGDNDSDCSESCNEASNNCTSNDPNGSSCNDGLFCTVTDTCTNGACGGTGNPCSANVGDNDSDCSESCNEASNNCTSNDINGSSCNDGLFCTVTDTCTNGSCGGTGNPCSANVGDNDSDCSESCNEASNNCTSNDPNASACNDGLFCTATDTCTAGVCGGTGNPCPGPNGDNDCSESCNEAANNCTANDPLNSACSDGLFCTSNDRCNNAGSCVGGVNPCPGPDGDQDCTETCNENSNNCTSDDPNNSVCGQECVIPGLCQNGSCIGGLICP